MSLRHFFINLLLNILLRGMGTEEEGKKVTSRRRREQKNWNFMFWRQISGCYFAQTSANVTS